MRYYNMPDLISCLANHLSPVLIHATDSRGNFSPMVSTDDKRASDSDVYNDEVHRLVV